MKVLSIIGALIGIIVPIVGGVVYAENAYWKQKEGKSFMQETKENLYKRIDEAENHQKLKVIELDLKLVRWEIKQLANMGALTENGYLELDRLKRKEKYLEEKLGY